MGALLFAASFIIAFGPGIIYTYRVLMQSSHLMILAISGFVYIYCNCGGVVVDNFISLCHMM